MLPRIKVFRNTPLLTEKWWLTLVSDESKEREDAIREKISAHRGDTSKMIHLHLIERELSGYQFTPIEIGDLRDGDEVLVQLGTDEIQYSTSASMVRTLCITTTTSNPNLPHRKCHHHHHHHHHHYHYHPIECAGSSRWRW